MVTRFTSSGGLGAVQRGAELGAAVGPQVKAAVERYARLFGIPPAERVAAGARALDAIDGWAPELAQEIPRPDGRRTVTLTEYGIVGKIGINSSGVGCLLPRRSYSPRCCVITPAGVARSAPIPRPGPMARRSSRRSRRSGLT